VIEEADIAFAQLKKVLSTLPVLVAPKEKEPLLLYIAATHQVVSTVLVVERSDEGKTHGVQWPENCIQCIHNSTETMAIFCGTPNHSGQQSTTIQYIEQPFSNRACLLMGN
jgi:hypothetical protein